MKCTCGNIMNSANKYCLVEATTSRQTDCKSQYGMTWDEERVITLVGKQPHRFRNSPSWSVPNPGQYSLDDVL